MEVVSCIVPAAGRSSRMGQWKPLLPFRGSTIIQTVVAVALSVCPRVIVVTGHRGRELEAMFRGNPGVALAANPEWEQGMFSSIRCGARLADTERFFIVLGDKPFITPEVYSALLGAPRADAVFPVFAGQRGHPVLLDQAVREAILGANPISGSMPGLLSAFEAREVPWTDDSILRDIDTPGQYEGVRAFPET